MRSDPQSLARFLWPKAPAVLACCRHEPEVPLLCAIHPWVGLRCRPCFISHAADIDLLADHLALPSTCTMCGDRVEIDPRVVAGLDPYHLRKSRDVNVILKPTAPLLLGDGGIYLGELLLCFDHWICDKDRQATPAMAALYGEISPPGVANS